MTDTTAEPPDADPALAEELRWVSAGATAARIRAGTLTPRAAVQAALLRLERAEPVLNAFTWVDGDRALADADVVARRLAAGESLPLAGVPIAIKDDVPVADTLVTWGSNARVRPQTATAATVERVRAAGAIVIGATRTPELCLMPYTESVRGGRTCNPWAPERTPGGSSGGSAAAVAAGVVPIALGGDGGGSLRAPGAWCGLPALFPTPGAVTDAPLGEKWFGMAVQGALARTIADTARIYDVLLDEPQDLSGAIVQPPPTGLRVGRTTSRACDRPLPHGGPIAGPWRRAAARGAELLALAGHDVVETTIDFAQTDAKFTVRFGLATEEEVGHTDEPRRVERTTRSILRMSRPLRGLRRWALDVAAERAAVARSLEGIDVIVTPTMPCAPPKLGERDRLPALASVLMAARRVSFLNSWNVIGWPGLTVPAGPDERGLPTAFLLVARPGQERLLLQLGAAFERTAPWPLGHAVSGRL